MREAEGHLLGELLPLHGHLEAVAEVDVQHLAGLAVQHEVAGMSVAQPQHVAHHAHHGQGAGVGGAALQPTLAVLGLQPENLRQVLTGSVGQGVLKHLQKREGERVQSAYSVYIHI